MGDIVDVYRTEFTSNMRLALQSGSQPKLAMLGGMENGSGELKLLENIVTARQGNKRMVRHQPTAVQAGQYDRTWVAQPGEDDDAELHDILDKVAAAIDPQSAFMQSSKRTINRARDDIWIGGYDGTGGFFGNRLSGKTGAVSVPFAGGNVVPVTVGGAASNMNLEKVLQAGQVLLQNFAEDDEEWYLGITANQRTALFKQYQMANADFRDAYKVKLSANGRQIEGAAGFTFVNFEFADPLLRYGGLTVEGGTGYRKNPFWTKSGMTRVPWYDVKTTIAMRSDLSDAWQTRWAFSETQTRTDEKRCGFILSNEAA